MTEQKDVLVLKAQSGDDDAMEKVLLQYKNVVRGIANRYFLVGGDREDLLQEGMYGLFKAVRDFDAQKTSFRTFAHTCILRQVLTAVKRYGNDKNKSLQFYVPLDDEVLKNASLTSSDPLESAIARESQEILDKKISDKLSPLEKSVAKLFINGFSYEEIATQLNKSVKSVDGALQRVRKKLV